jgi:biopolymer transport protein ExbD
MQSERHRRNQLICGINGTPFVYVTVILSFMLLLFFLAWPKPLHGGLIPDLPQVGHPVSMAHANREDAMIIVIFRDDRIFFRNDRIEPDQLAARIRDSINKGSEKKVYIRADARVKYSWVAEVLDGVRSAGVEKIGFLVNERQAPSPKPQ